MTDSSEPFLGIYLQSDRYSYRCRSIVPYKRIVAESDAGKCRHGILQCECSAQFVEFGKKEDLNIERERGKAPL